MYELHKTEQIYEKNIPNLKHESDGFIFTPVNYGYYPGRFELLLKWKPPELNTADFLFRIDYSKDQSGKTGKLYILSNNQEIPKGELFLDSSIDSKLFDGKIVECSWNPNANSWKLFRYRPDKDLPNGLSTFQRIEKSIRDWITINQLFDYIAKITNLK
ncbi:mRNA-capping enzyme subunit alpha [Anaeramoeba ignava]|uniref:mRNA guanylyltransferase n=1 Tax=Anaeramoeba ignava TaxID=1746090 RepID=A0A9Q0LD20_ANAIG|nr:mRNA-capping enzyme subunit alpha [Anaeramoeba ignava]